jgi:hypothetical protein
MNANQERSLPWRLEDIPFDRIDPSLVRHRDDLFYLVTASSFVEILSDLTTLNLVTYYAGDAEVGGWLSSHWEHEEVQHGKALREYVLRVWPEFDWDSTYARFFAEYSQICTVDELEPTRCLEMAARCVVEMGTATYYRALAEFAPEPVLRALALRIKDDEIRHYKHFYRFFTIYRERESLGRWRVFGALMRRLAAVRSDDAEIALWHAFESRHPGARRDTGEFRSMFSQVSRLVRRHFPADMAIKMLVKPLDLHPIVSSALIPPLSQVTERWILR